MQKKAPPTYFNFLNTIREFDEEQLADISYFLKEDSLKRFLFKKSPHGIILLNYYLKKYEYVSPNILRSTGINWTKLLEDGPSQLLQMLHPDDLRIFNEEVFRDQLAFLSTIPIEEHKCYRFSANYRLQGNNGKYHQILQQSTYIRSAKFGLPLINFATATDITYFKQDDRMVLKIERIERNGTCREVFFKSYFPVPEGEKLTKKEEEILKWMLEGLNSHEIADKMNISFHTVKTHRKNILEKVNAKNTADLIRYVATRGLMCY